MDAVPVNKRYGVFRRVGDLLFDLFLNGWSDLVILKVQMEFSDARF